MRPEPFEPADRAAFIRRLTSLADAVAAIATRIESRQCEEHADPFSPTPFDGERAEERDAA